MFTARKVARAPEVVQHIPRMQRVARRILGRDDLAHDAVQEALITAHLIDELPVEHLEAWLVRTVANRSLVERRAHLRRKRNEAAAADWIGGEMRISDPERELRTKQLGSQIVEALRALPPCQLGAFLAREVDGSSYEQIAEVQRVPVGTVRSRLNRARRALREQLRPPAARREEDAA